MISNLFMWLSGFSVVCYLIALVKPAVFSRFTKGLPNRKKSLEITSLMAIFFLILWFISSLTLNTGKQKEIVNNDLAQTATNSSLPEVAKDKTVASGSTMDQLWNALDLSRKTKEGYDVQYDSSPKTASVVFTIPGDSLWDETWIVKSAYATFVKYGTEAFKVDGVDKLFLTYKGNFIDSYGKESLVDALVFSMPKEEFMKYDWNNLADSGIPIHTQFETSCSYYYIHPSITKNVDFNKIYLNLNL